MNAWGIILRVIIFIISIAVIAFNAEIYIFCKQERKELDAMSDQQKMEAVANSKKIKYQQDQIDHLTKDLEDSQQQIKDQNDALNEQKEENKSIQTSLVDIKAEADAIKQDMKDWQKDYVGVFADLKKNVDNIQEQIKNQHESLNPLPGTPPEPQKKQ